MNIGMTYWNVKGHIFRIVYSDRTASIGVDIALGTTDYDHIGHYLPYGMTVHQTIFFI